MSASMNKLSPFCNSKLKVQKLAKFHFDYIDNSCYYIQLNKFNEMPYFGLCMATTTDENQAQSFKYINMPADLWCDFVKAVKRMLVIFPLDAECM